MNKMTDPNQLEEVFSSLKLHLYHGLLGEVIPALRAISLNWKPGEIYAELLFFHITEVNEDIIFHNGCIEVEASSSGMPSWKGVELGFEEKSLFLPASEPLPKATQIVFAYQGEGIGPQQISPFWSPSWHMESNILLKTNEALVGRLPKNLRLVALNWKPESNQATMKFYHIGEISPKLEESYLEIYNLVRSIPYQHQAESLKFSIELHSTSEKKPLPKEEITSYLYLRAEPFKDPVD